MVKNRYRLIIMALMLLTAITLGANESSFIRNELLDDSYWENLSGKEGTRFRRKAISGYDLYALEIIRESNLSAFDVFEVLLDVGNYGEILADNDYLYAEEVERNESSITGYQHASLPVVSNRHYLFNFDLAEWEKEAAEQIISWVLVEPEGKYAEFISRKDKQFKNPLYIRNGAGIWKVRDMGNGRYEHSYRLYLDPSGWMPQFIVNNFNKRNLKDLFDRVLATAAERSNR